MMNFNPDNYEIIDAHIHPCSDIPGTDYTLFGKHTDCASMVDELQKVGISQGCGAVICTCNYDTLTFNQIHELNLAGLAQREAFPDFYIPGITVHPKFPEESCREIESMRKENEVRLVGELVAYSMGYRDYDIPEMNPIWETIRDLDMPVNVHLNRVEEAASILRKFPTLKFIIAHPTSSISEYQERLEIIAQYPNAAIDISGSGPNSWGMLRYAIAKCGKEKIIFGTDFPLRNPGMYVAGVYAERLAPDEMEAIFSGNIKRLLG